MKTGKCSQCENAEVYEIGHALVPDQDSSNGIRDFAITAAYGMYGKDMANARIAAHVSAFVCAKCGYTEMFVNNLDVLATLARTGAGNVRKVTRT